jgi:hypothetical protein
MVLFPKKKSKVDVCTSGMLIDMALMPAIIKGIEPTRNEKEQFS